MEEEEKFVPLWWRLGVKGRLKLKVGMAVLRAKFAQERLKKKNEKRN